MSLNGNSLHLQPTTVLSKYIRFTRTGTIHHNNMDEIWGELKPTSDMSHSVIMQVRVPGGSVITNNWY